MSYLGESIGKLGFGLMRLPMLANGEVDVEQVKQMADLFLSRGYTYFDTAYGYIGGKSEEAVKPVLVDRYPRESFQLATKLPAWAGAKDAKASWSYGHSSHPVSPPSSSSSRCCSARRCRYSSSGSILGL